MSDLPANIGQHLKNTFDEGELAQLAVVRNFFTTAADGRITHEKAVGQATEEYGAFHRERLTEQAAQPDDFDQAIRALPAAKPAGKKKRGAP